MRKEEYIAEVISLVKNKSAKREIQKELEAHIEDRILYYTDAGYDEEYASYKAIEKMGEPRSVAESMEKLHNNSIYIIITVVALALYIAGMVFADIKSYDYAIINMVDFAEVGSIIPCLVSSLMFLAGAVAFWNARKSKSSALLGIVGVVSLVTPFVSPYSLIPFGYTVVSLFTDFPVSVVKGNAFLGGEVFWEFDDLFVNGSGAIYYVLVILSILISLLCAVIAIISFISANEEKAENHSKALEKKINKFAIFALVIGVLAVATASAEGLYDFQRTYRENYYAEQHQGIDYLEAKKAFDEYELPITKEELKEYAVENNYDEYAISEVEEFSNLIILDNGQYWVQITSFDNNDDIIESKRLLGPSANLTSEQKKKLNTLKEGSSFNQLTDIVSPMNFGEYRESLDGDDVDAYVSIHTAGNEYFELYYKNGILVENSYDKWED